MSIEFTPWPKTPRLFRDVVITEKIDGTNAAIGLTEDGVIYAQSRKRLITPEQDNFGFARWVSDNAETLAEDLGPGLHFGEWWGKGIQRGYARNEKHFSLFNTKRFDGYGFATPNLSTVPVIFEGLFSQYWVDHLIDHLRQYGSYVSPEPHFPAEGICIYHTAANSVFKVTLENDEAPKSLAS